MTRQEFKKYKGIVRNYLQTAYSDKNLAQILDHARAGKLAYYSCCCFAGIPTADHASGELYETFTMGHSVSDGNSISYDITASCAYYYLGRDKYHDLYSRENDPLRRRTIIPMILAEIRRRERLKQTVAVEEVAVGQAQ